VQRDSEVVSTHNLILQGLHPTAFPPPSVAGVPRCRSDRSKRLVTFSTFGSPVPYLPQAAAIGMMRALDLGVDGMLLASRLATLAVYVALVWLAIHRAPRSAWALCATGLLPVALFQTAVSMSHDAVTTAVVLLVVSSALRAANPPPGASRNQLLVEAAILTTILGICDAGYVIVAVCYLLPLLGARRRWELLPLALAPVLGAIVSVAWNEFVGGLWKPDASAFGVKVDPARQWHLLLAEPWRFVGVAAQTVADNVGSWARDLVTMDPNVAVWPGVAVVATTVVLWAVALQWSAHEADRLVPSQRLLILGVFLVGALVVLGRHYVYSSPPGDDVVRGVQARCFTPLLALVPIAIGPLGFRWARSVTTRVPVALALAPLYAALAVTITFRMF
jgi:uncharacterized membrane protein